MRIVSIVPLVAVALFVAFCGFHPQPMSGAVVCTVGGSACCPAHYVCVGRGAITADGLADATGTCWSQQDLPPEALSATHDYTPNVLSDPACLVTDWLPPDMGLPDGGDPGVGGRIISGGGGDVGGVGVDSGIPSGSTWSMPLDRCTKKDQPFCCYKDGDPNPDLQYGVPKCGWKELRPGDVVPINFARRVDTKEWVTLPATYELRQWGPSTFASKAECEAAKTTGFIFSGPGLTETRNRNDDYHLFVKSDGTWFFSSNVTSVGYVAMDDTNLSTPPPEPYQTNLGCDSLDKPENLASVLVIMSFLFTVDGVSYETLFYDTKNPSPYYPERITAYFVAFVKTYGSGAPSGLRVP